MYVYILLALPYFFYGSHSFMF
uniref:NADH dehydrogenase subunit 4 n=1 Tax=Heterorhabditis bacteriophora TaxID=37862 RepID=A0A1I7X208_HETBA